MFLYQIVFFFTLLDNIKKGQMLVKYTNVIDQYRNTRMWFAHVDCMIKKLQREKKKMENIVPKYKVEVGE